MDLLFFTEARLWHDKQHRHFCSNPSFSGQMFQRYRSTYDHVYIVARSFELPVGLLGTALRVEDTEISVLELPAYIGPGGYLLIRRQLSSTIRRYLAAYPCAAVICRVPGLVGDMASRYLVRSGRPYGVEVVGDPDDVFSPGAYKHPLRAIFRYISSKGLAATVNNASASLFVTQTVLQEKYPPANKTFTTYASNVMLPNEAFTTDPKKFTPQGLIRIVAVGTLAAMYKAPDVLIDAIVHLKRNHFNVSVKWLGDGKHLNRLIEYTEKRGVSGQIEFSGNISSVECVRQHLDQADLFVLPSRQEGLPRALVEAMARGLPCIGTRIGGIPELLDSIAIVPVNSHVALADCIMMFYSMPALMITQAERNLNKAKQYSIALLNDRRRAFYYALRELTPLHQV